MPSAYIASLNRELEQAGEATSVPQLDLRQRLMEWHGGLPEIARYRPFAMAEIELALRAQGKYLSPIMLKLGWIRRRRWSSGGQYSRYWVPSVVHRPPQHAPKFSFGE